MKTKFEFDSDYQYEILRFIILYPEGYKAIPLLETEYFSLLQHQVLFYAINKFYKETGRTPKTKLTLSLT